MPTHQPVHEMYNSRLGYVIERYDLRHLLCAQKQVIRCGIRSLEREFHRQFFVAQIFEFSVVIDQVARDILLYHLFIPKDKEINLQIVSKRLGVPCSVGHQVSREKYGSFFLFSCTQFMNKIYHIR